MMIRGFGVCVVLLFLSLPLQAQCDIEVDHFCNDADIICDPVEVLNVVHQMNDTTCFKQDTVIKCLGIWDINFDNPYWFRFMANESNLHLEFMIDNCMAGSSGIQYALLNDCDYDDTLECVASNGGAPFGIEGLITITEPVEAGQIYGLIIDGFGGSVCDIEFLDIQGVGTITLDPISLVKQEAFGNDTICLGAENVLFDLDFPLNSNIEFGNYFIWSLNHEGSAVLDTMTLDSSIVLDFNESEGNYELCAFAINACDTTNIVCTQFYVEQIPDRVLDTFQFCLNDLPLPPDDPEFMSGDLISSVSPNPAVFSIVNGFGCVFNQLVPLDPLSDSKRYFLDTAICGTGPVSIMGQIFNTDQTELDIVLEGMAANDCDSLITLNLAFLDFSGSLIADNCSSDTVTIDFMTIIPIPMGTDTVIFRWTNNMGQAMTNTSNGGRTLKVTDRGMYFLELIVERFGTQCIQNYEIYVEAAQELLSLSCDSIGLNELGIVWNSIDYSAAYDIWINENFETTINDTSFLITGLEPEEMINFQVISVHAGICPGVSNSISCQTEACPPVSLTISPPDTTYCYTSDLDDILFDIEFANNPFMGAGIWSGDFIDPNTGLFNTQLAGEGNHWVYYNYDSNGCSYQDSVLLVATQTPEIQLIADTLICVDDQLEVLVTGSFDMSALFNWDLGSASLSGDNSGPFQLNWDLAGEYDISLQLDQASCLSNKDSIYVSVTPSIIPPVISCMGSLDSLYFEWNHVDCVSSFRVFIDGVDQGVQTDSFFVLEGLLPDQTVTFGLLAISDCICGDILVEDVCSTAPCPMIPAPEIFCSGSTDSLYFQWSSVECTDLFQVFIDGTDQGIQTDTFFILENLMPEQIVDFELRAINECLCPDIIVMESCSTMPCPDPGLDGFTCMATTGSISIEWNQMYCTSNYQIFIDGQDRGLQTDTFYTIPDLDPEQEVQIEIVGINECACDNENIIETCFAMACPIIEIDLDPVDPICEYDIVDLIPLDIQVSGSNGTGTGFWSGDYLDDSGVFDPFTSGVGSHRVYYHFDEIGCHYVDSMQIMINENPIASYMVEPPLCPGENTALVDIMASGGDGNYLYELGPISQVNPIFEDVMIGSYHILVEDGNGCLFDTLVNIELPEIPEFNIVGPDIVRENESFTLELLGDFDWPGITSIQWLNNSFPVACNGLGCDFIFKSTISEDAVFCAEVRYQDRCAVTTCFPLLVKKEINVFVPNVIYLNSDIQNDQFFIATNDQLLYVNYIRVFDRWGEVMWQVEDIVPSENANISWDGRFQGEKVNSGVYIYMVELVDLNGETIRMAGDLTVLR